MAARLIEANGIQLRCELTDGPGRRVVLIHEMGGMLESWDEVVGPLSAHASVLRYDQRGVGLSEKPRGPVTVEQLAADLAGLLDSLDIREPVAVAGMAVGASVAAAFAALYPARCGALLMLAPATGLEGDRRATALGRIELIEGKGVRAAVLPGAPARFREMMLAADPEGLCAIWRMLTDLDLDDLLGRIACPTLVAAAIRDTWRPPETIAAVAEMIPGAQLIALDATHYMAFEAPKLIVGTIVAFLEECGFT